MSTNLTSGSFGDRNAQNMRVAMVCARFNDVITEQLAASAREVFLECGVFGDDIHTVWVPGAWEIPAAAAALARSGRFDAIVGVGAVIRGETYHFDVIADQSAAGLMRVGLDTGVVVANAILTLENEAQARARVKGGAAGDKGAEAAYAAIETINAIRSSVF